MNVRASSRVRGGAGQNPVLRTGELAKKRERRTLRFRVFLFGGLLLLLLLGSAYYFWLRDSSLVEVKNLDVVGVNTKNEEGRQIDQAVRTAVGEMTTLHAKPELLDQELSRYPRVAAAEIEMSFPDSATVTVALREDGSVLGEGSGALLIATDGTVLGPAGGQEDALPLIGDGDVPRGSGSQGTAGKPAGPGQVTDPIGTPAGQSLTGRTLSQALVLGAAPKEIKPYVMESRTTPAGVEVELENGLVLLFGDRSQPDQKWRAATALIADPSFETDSYVDLTVPRRPGVTPQTPTSEAPEEGTVEASELPATG